MTLDETEIWSLSRLGYVLYSRGRLDEAVAIFHGLLHLDPGFAYGWYLVGIIRRDRDDTRGAMQALQHALSCDARCWAARVALAELLYQNGRLTDAEKVLKPVMRETSAQPVAADAAIIRRGKTLWKCWH